MILTKDFYLRDTHTVARELLGKTLVRVINGKRISCRITETESYLGVIDKASHAYGGRRTHRTETMFKEGGIAYVYLIYGMYFCLNAVTEKEGTPNAVLIRGGKALSGLDDICFFRYGKTFDEATKFQRKNLLNGPGKLCMGLNITKAQNALSLYSDSLFIEDTGFSGFEMCEGKRINIDYAEEFAEKPWRFFIKDI